MQRGSDSYEAEVDGEFHIGNDQMRMTMLVEVSGSDLKGTVTLAQQRERLRFSMIRKGGASYIKPAGEPWSRVEEVEFAAPGSPLDMDADALRGLQYAGRVTRDGVRLHHLRLPAMDWRALSAAFLDQDQAGLHVNDMAFDVWVTDSGVPHSARIVFDGMSLESGFEADVSLRLDYRFRRYGEPIHIEAPAEYIDDRYSSG